MSQPTLALFQGGIAVSTIYHSATNSHRLLSSSEALPREGGVLVSQTATTVDFYYVWFKTFLKHLPAQGEGGVGGQSHQ